MLAAAEEFARDMRSPWMCLHVALKKPGVVRLYRDEGYDVVGVDPGILGWRGRLLMRKSMGKASIGVLLVRGTIEESRTRE